MNRDATNEIEGAITALRNGDPLLIHDFEDRENETDIICSAEAVQSETVAQLRNDAGGLICVALSHEVAEAFELPFLSEAIDHPCTTDHDIEYDDRPSFSLPVNHRETFTGITDVDRALTIKSLAAAAADPKTVDFASEFRSPGHVHLLRAASGLLATRRGHTELGIVLSEVAGIAPAVVVCEMLDDDSGQALPTTVAREYADDHGYPFLEGEELIEHFG